MKFSGESAEARTTYRLDLSRSLFYGVLEAGWMTFALVVAIRAFDAPESFKALIAGSGPLGLLLAPAVLFVAARMRARPAPAAACLFLGAAVLLTGATLAQSFLLFAGFIICSHMSGIQYNSLMLQIYADNYRSSERGSRLGAPFILTALSSILFSLAGGRILDADIGYYRIIFAIMVLAALACAVSTVRIPSTPLSTANVGNPWQSISLIWKDKFFGYLLGTWMFMGLGNLITIPIRVEYLAAPKFGINADNTTIAFLVLVVPATTRILSTRMWGSVFDRLNFVTTRNLLNCFLLLGIALFFFTSNLILLTLGMACAGIAMGGGKIFWSLWVTKIAPSEKASSYMSVHMALTGLRGALAPFVGYWILANGNPASVAVVGLVMITVATLLFERARGHPRLATGSAHI
ncbi:MAG: MFS transporter [Opitutales bacterium]